MKRAGTDIFIMMSSVLICVVMIGSIHLANERLITSVEYTSLKELTQVAHGISHMIGAMFGMNFVVNQVNETFDLKYKDKK